MIRLAWLLALIAGPCAAQDRVSLLVGSHHASADSDFEENNPGLFLTWDRFTVGAYTNSYSRTSIAATYALPLWHGEEWSVDLFAGVAHYPINGREFAIHAGDWVPIGGLQARYRQLFVQVMPSDGKAADAIFTFGMTFATH